VNFKHKSDADVYNFIVLSLRTYEDKNKGTGS